MKRILSLFLILLLLLPAGCKQQDSEIATPGEVVENSNFATSKEGKRDYFVCTYYVYLRNECAEKNYSLEDFGDLNAEELESFPNPLLYYIHATYTDKQAVSNTARLLREHKDVKNITLKYTAYLVAEDAIAPQLPSLERESILVENKTISDGEIGILIEHSDVAENHVLSLSDFPVVSAEAISITCYENQSLGSLYLTTRGEEALKTALNQLDTIEYGQKASLIEAKEEMA